MLFRQVVNNAHVWGARPDDAQLSGNNNNDITTSRYGNVDAGRRRRCVDRRQTLYA